MVLDRSMRSSSFFLSFSTRMTPVLLLLFPLFLLLLLVLLSTHQLCFRRRFPPPPASPSLPPSPSSPIVSSTLHSLRIRLTVSASPIGSVDLSCFICPPGGGAPEKNLSPTIGEK
uniref:Secreted protein n=1 Tax=Caenorhabditis tropicalis TaxID=1561998 RepID=A0A1I7UFJ2_9PELO